MILISPKIFFNFQSVSSFLNLVMIFILIDALKLAIILSLLFVNLILLSVLIGNSDQLRSDIVPILSLQKYKVFSSKIRHNLVDPGHIVLKNKITQLCDDAFVFNKHRVSLNGQLLKLFTFIHNFYLVIEVFKFFQSNPGKISSIVLILRTQHLMFILLKIIDKLSQLLKSISISQNECYGRQKLLIKCVQLCH